MNRKLIYFTLCSLLYFVSAPASAEKSTNDTLATTPINLSLLTPIELFPLKPRRVVGVSLNVLYGHEEELWGLQAGMVNSADSLQGFQVGVLNISDGGTGFQAGLFQWVDGDLIGVQLGLTNYVRNFSGLQVSAGNIATDANGIQVGAGSNSNENFSGLQVGLWNSNRKNFSGIQLGLMNENQMETRSAGSIQVGNVEYSQLQTTQYTGGSSDGIQIALVLNQALLTNGVQLGLFNFSAQMNGLQIGVINYSKNLKGVQIGLLNFNTSGLYVSPGLNIGW